MLIMHVIPTFVIKDVSYIAYIPWDITKKKELIVIKFENIAGQKKNPKGLFYLFENSSIIWAT